MNAPYEQRNPGRRTRTLFGFECVAYEISVAGEPLRIWGPASPDTLLDRDDVRRRFDVDEHMPYWSTPWPASVMLAEQVIEERCDGQGVMLEVGAGLGVASIALARAGMSVMATDCDADALRFIGENARENGVELAGVEALDWRDPPRGRFETILGADVLFERRHVEPVVSLIAKMLTPTGRAYISDVHRQSAAGFVDRLGTHGLTCEQIPKQTPALGCMPGDEPRIIEGVIYRVRRAEAA